MAAILKFEAVVEYRFYYNRLMYVIIGYQAVPEPKFMNCSTRIVYLSYNWASCSVF